MPSHARDPDDLLARVPLARSASGASDDADADVDADADAERDLDAGGIIAPSSSPPQTRRAGAAPFAPGPLAESTLWHDANAHFARQWRKIPAAWSVERDPGVALRHLLTLFAFLSLCIFVFSVPSLLYLVSPRAPAPPGSAPDLDEAASMISGARAAVAADVPRCSRLGLAVMQEARGNAVDAAVATTLCQGVLAPFASGMGGGAFIMYYDPRERDARFYDARETAPAAVTMAHFEANATAARFNGLAVAVPGELAGLEALHADAGALSWRDVVAPVIAVARDARVGKYLAIKLRQMNETVFASPSLEAIFTKRVPTAAAANAQDAAAAAELPGVRRDLRAHSGARLDAVDRGVVDALTAGTVVADASDKDEHGVGGSATVSATGAKAATPTTPAPPTTTTAATTTAAPAANTAVADDAAGATPRAAGPAGARNGTTEATKHEYTRELLAEGDRLDNPALVATLELVAEHGAKALYHNLSDELAAEVRAAGGVMTRADIYGYRVVRRPVVRSRYQGFHILGASAPAAGGPMIALALNMIRNLQFRAAGRNARTYQRLVETLKWVFAAAMRLADPDFEPASASWQERMLTRREAARRAYRVSDQRTFAPGRYAAGVSTSALEGGTSHVSVVDANGTAVSLTSSINLPFGAGLVSNRTGLVLNDQMDAFTTSRTRVNAFGMFPAPDNAVRGGKRALSSMCPTIVLRGDATFLVVGAGGGPRAVSSVLQTILNVLDFGDSVSDAISAPRAHHQLVPNRVSLEGVNATTCGLEHALKRPSDGKGGAVAWGYWESVCAELKKIGHEVEGPAVHGAVQAVLVPKGIDGSEDDDEDDDGKDKPREPRMFAVSDPRHIGKAAAY